MGARCARRQGMSLLEVVVVLAILVALAALAVPAIAPRLDRRAASEAEARLSLAVVRAQSTASVEGRPLRIVLTGEDAPRLMAEPLSLPTEAQATRDSPPRRLLAELPAGCTLAVGGRGEDLTEPEVFGTPRDGSPEPDEVVVGWALPDGTFEPAGELTLKTRRGERAVVIDSWTGVIADESPPQRDPSTVADGRGRSGVAG